MTRRNQAGPFLDVPLSATTVVMTCVEEPHQEVGFHDNLFSVSSLDLPRFLTRNSIISPKFWPFIELPWHSHNIEFVISGNMFSLARFRVAVVAVSKPKEFAGLLRR